MKLLHVADLHIDRAFEGISYHAKFEQRLLDAGWEMLMRITDLAIKEQVDCVLIAGDTFHHGSPSARMQHLFFQELERLGQAQIPVFLIFGNHDYYNAQRYWFHWPENVYLFEGEKVATYTFITKKGERVAVSGFSYEHPHIGGQAKEFPERTAQEDIHIGLYHGEMGKGYYEDEEGRYAPFLLTELKAKNYDYWALGHIHKPEVLSQEPPIIYAGTPQGHSRKELGAKGVVLAELTADACHYRWHEVSSIAYGNIRAETDEQMSRTDFLFLLKEKIRQLAEVRSAQLLIIAVTIACQGNELKEWQMELAQNYGPALVEELLTGTLQSDVLISQVTCELVQPADHLPLGVTEKLLTFAADEVSQKGGPAAAMQELTRRRELAVILAKQNHFDWDTLFIQAQKEASQQLKVGGQDQD